MKNMWMELQGVMASPWPAGSSRRNINPSPRLRKLAEVIERSKQSLRGFYEYFDGKDELVLALFEETLREADADIQRAVDAESDPLARLRAFH